MRTAHFKVDPRLTALLGENYRSSELAIKELIDNAWDAEATEVHVTLPDILSEAALIISDNGSGMKAQEVETEYLNIASPRWTRKGERTPKKLRVVKGRKGIGKFAGLILAATMELRTRANCVETYLRISKADILGAEKDLEKVPLPLETQVCGKQEHGTEIRLTNFNQSLNYPHSEKLRELLAYDYGKETDFLIFVNGERVFRHDIQGQTFEKDVILPNGQPAKFTYTIADKPVPASKAGIVLRQGEKTIGKPHFFGLEFDDTLSDRLRRRVVGEVSVPAEALELTAAGGDVIESDKGFEELSRTVQDSIKESLVVTHKNEVNLAKARWVQKMNKRLESVPEHRRTIIEERLQRLISRSYQEGEKEERIDLLVDLVLDAMEMDEYWTVCKEIREAEQVDVFHFANALEKFGLCDLAFIGQQAKRRLEFLESLDRLAADPQTSEQQMHLALQHNLWVFGVEYSLMASNRQLQRIVADYAREAYQGKDAMDRPDLLLAANILKQHLLLEFKRPSITVGRDAEAQAKKYADVLHGKLGMSLQILIVGGEVDPKLQQEYSGKQTQFASYRLVVANARTELEWLLKELSSPPAH